MQNEFTPSFVNYHAFWCLQMGMVVLLGMKPSSFSLCQTCHDKNWNRFCVL